MKQSVSRTVASAIVLAALAGCSADLPTATLNSPAELRMSASASAAKVFTVTSPAFRNGESFPALYACPVGYSPVIGGANRSPLLHWINEPRDTRSFAIVMDDPDAPIEFVPTGLFTHWITWGINALTPTLPSGRDGAMVGTNDFGVNFYVGPCPPPNTGVHHYTFHVYALSEALSLDAGASRAAFDAAIAGKVLAEARLMGTVDTRMP